jgi:sterol desaturase/sphingolipid hydroxylase (fatty acid hydroxylase superfamily)
MLILCGCVVALFVGTLAEYLLHVWMHGAGAKTVLGRYHRHHHHENDGQGVLREFVDYMLFVIVFGFIPFMVLLWLSDYLCYFFFGWFIGAIVYAFIAAYCHQLQHDCPEAVFWMPFQVHFWHHENKVNSNYGITNCFWDWLFGTLEPAPKILGKVTWRSYLKVKWW